MAANRTDLTNHACDVCGSDRAHEIACASHYMQGWPLHVCADCGFVYVRARRHAQAIADSWSDELYGTHYTARIPAVVARHAFVAEFAHAALALGGKRVCDIGAGEGTFIDLLRGPSFGADVFGIEPSAANGKLMAGMGLPHFVGTIEAYRQSPDVALGAFDVAMVLWTLENCQSCKTMLHAAYDLLKPGGHIVVATGSRILVPFKKPLQYYLGPGDQDTHCFRFSRNSLTAALANSGFRVVATNRDIDSDVLCVAAQKVGRDVELPRPKDDAGQVLDFFARWHVETQAHYKDR
jgi:SAM-dependent methyltransferase